MELKHPLANVKHPVTGTHVTSGTVPMQKEVDASFGNMHGNLLNSLNDTHEDTDGAMIKTDQLKAMARRMGRVY